MCATQKLKKKQKQKNSTTAVVSYGCKKNHNVIVLGIGRGRALGKRRLYCAKRNSFGYGRERFQVSISRTFYEFVSGVWDGTVKDEDVGESVGKKVTTRATTGVLYLFSVKLSLGQTEFLKGSEELYITRYP